MRIMWNSVAPWVPTGYGQQTAQTVTRLQAAGHDVAISANYGWQGGLGNWNGIPVYPSDHTGLQKQALKYHVNHWAKANDWDPSTVLVITLFDVHTWVNPKYGGIVANFHGLNQTAWVPVDHMSLPPLVEGALKEYKVTRPIAMSRFGYETLTGAGFDALYVPHGIDTNVFQPYDRLGSREFIGAGPDKFVIGMVANNSGNSPPRKAFPQVFHAFRTFLEKHPDAFLYLHSEMFGFHDGVNLLRMAEWFDIPQNAIGAVDQAMWHIEIPNEVMARVYSAMDVLVNPSYGEGFGVPIVEAQACGTPVIVNNTTSMPELCGAGWMADGEPLYDPTQIAMFQPPSVADIVKCFEAAYEARNDDSLRIQARVFAEAYDADLVFDEYWVPALEELDKPREAPPLVPLNRAMRRKQKAAA